MGDAATRVAAAGGRRRRPRPLLRHATIGTARSRRRSPASTSTTRALPDWSADGPGARGRRDAGAAPRSRRRRSRTRRRGDRLSLASGPGAGGRRARDRARRAREQALRPRQPIVVDRRGHFRRAQPGHPRLRADRRTPARRSRSGSTPSPRSWRHAPSVLGAAPADWTDRARRECQAARALFGEALPAWVRGLAAADAWRRGRHRCGRVDRRIVHRRAARSRQLGALARRVARQPIAPPTRAVPICSNCCCARGHWITTPIADLLQRGDRRAERGHGAARGDGASISAAGPRSRNCWRREHPSAEDYLARFEREMDGVPAGRARPRPGHLARRAVAIRADSRAYSRRRAVTLLPELPIAGAVRSVTGCSTTSFRRSTD